MSRSALGFALVLALVAGCAPSSNPGPTAPAASAQLPGQQIWRDGVSSYLFGINQSYDWSARNLENTPAAQAALKRAGFTLIRTFFSEHHQGWPFHAGVTTDQDIELRLRAIENSGAQCLGVLSVEPDAAFDSSRAFLDHVMTYAETSRPRVNRCRLWEYGNEYGNTAAYLRRWNADVPSLRARHPQARIIGAVLANPYPDQMQAFLDGVKASGVLPDAISYHDYPCYKAPDFVDSPADAAACDALVTPRFERSIATIRSLIRSTLGRDLPLGITEWNVSPNFVNLVGGRIPLTVSPSYQPRFIQEMYAAMRAGGVAFAAEEDAMCGGGFGTAGSLDLIDQSGTPQPWISAFQAAIQAAASG